VPVVVTYVRPEHVSRVWMRLPCDKCTKVPSRVTTWGRRYCRECGPSWWATDEAPVAMGQKGSYPPCIKCGGDTGPFSPLEGQCRSCKFGQRI
jgi:hypothetical protein